MTCETVPVWFYLPCPIWRCCKDPTVSDKRPLRRCWWFLWISSPCTCGAAKSSPRSCLPGGLPSRRVSSSSTPQAWWWWRVAHQENFFNPPCCHETRSRLVRRKYYRENFERRHFIKRKLLCKSVIKQRLIILAVWRLLNFTQVVPLNRK